MKRKLLALPCLISLLLAACGEPTQPPETPPPTATIAPQPTPTSEPTPTPEPEYTPRPTLPPEAYPTLPPVEDTHLLENIGTDRRYYAGVSATFENFMAVRPDGSLLLWGERGPSYWYDLSMLGPVRGVDCGDFSQGLVIDQENALWAFRPSDWFDPGPTYAYSDGGLHKLADDVVTASHLGEMCLFLRADGSVWVCGADENGLLGLGPEVTDLRDPEHPETAVRKVFDHAVYAVVHHGGACYAIDEDGVLWGWGDVGIADENGETRRFVPTRIMDDVADADWGLAVKTDGTLWAWGTGWGRYESLPYLNGGAPVQIMEDVAMARRTDGDFVVLKTDGSLYAWGENWKGALPGVEEDFSTEPVHIMDDVYYAAGSWGNLLIVKNNGELWETGICYNMDPSDGSKPFALEDPDDPAPHKLCDIYMD